MESLREDGKSSDVLNLRQDVKAAEVALTFQHEDNTYRVQRTLPRNKNTVLEFQVRTEGGLEAAQRKNDTTKRRHASSKPCDWILKRSSTLLLFAGQGRSIHAAECHTAQGSVQQHPWP